MRKIFPRAFIHFSWGEKWFSKILREKKEKLNIILINLTKKWINFTQFSHKNFLKSHAKRKFFLIGGGAVAGEKNIYPWTIFYLRMLYSLSFSLADDLTVSNSTLSFWTSFSCLSFIDLKQPFNFFKFISLFSMYFLWLHNSNKNSPKSRLKKDNTSLKSTSGLLKSPWQYTL